MKILQVIDGLGTGGAEKLMVDMVPRLADAGNQVDVVLLDNTPTPFFEELKASKACNIFALGKGFYNPLYIWKLSRLIRGYDVVHVHLFPAQYFAVFAKILSRARAKFIFTEHNTTNRRIENPRYSKIENFIYSQCDRVICITPEVRDTLVHYLHQPVGKFEVVTNGIDTQKFENAKPASRSDFSFSASDKLLVMVAGFREQKDQDTVIRALQNLPAHYKLLLVGDGKRKEALVALAKRLNLSHRVTFLGVRDDVAQIYKMCDVAVLSSHWEGFGLAAVEAMAAQIPLVASNVSGLAEVVSAGGLLFQKNNEKDLAAKILSLEDIEYRNSIVLAGSKRAREFDISKMVSEILQLYSRVLDEK